jgi:small redox-active disulfide protein 2
MDIKILGPGCFNCKRLDAHTREALAMIGIEADIEKIEDIADIMAYGIMRTPGLVIDGRIVLAGQVPSPNRLADILREHVVA